MERPTREPRPEVRRDPGGRLLQLEMDRRRFLALLGSLTAAGALAACAPSEPRPSATGGPASTGPVASGDASQAANGSPAAQGRYDLIRQLRTIIQASPDHLGAAAAAAVATGDPARIVEFVRDRIAILPATSSTADPTTDARWGARGALRSGSGTLRERADLLVDLLGRAGITGRVMRMPRPSSYPGAALAAPVFGPDLAALGALWDVVDRAHPALDVGHDPAGALVETTTERILSALPAELRTARLTGPGLPEAIPIVEFDHGGRTQWATALGDRPVLGQAPDGMFGASETVIPRVSVGVSVALNPPAGATLDRTVLHEVLRAEWSAAEVAGRALVLGFPGPGTPTEAVGRSLESAVIRQPVLRLETSEPLGDTQPLALGDFLSSAGGVFAPSPDRPGSLVGPLGPLVDPAGPGAGERVATVAGRVNAAAFPEIELWVAAQASDGSAVDGLSAADFAVTEDGQVRPVTLIANTAPREVRVLVVYDTSGSVTSALGTPKKKAALEAGIAAALGRAAQASPFVVQVIGVGDHARDGGWIAPEPTALAAALASTVSNSDVWTTLGDAVPASGASAVLLVSDNEAHDLPDQIPAFQRRLRASAVPVACLPLGNVDKATTAAILAIGAGPRLDMTAGDFGGRLEAFVRDQVERTARANYRLRYRAAPDGPSARAVGVAIVGAGAAPLKLGYAVPAEVDRAAPSGIAGVYLTIRVGDHEAVRRLAGVRASARGIPEDTSDAAAIEAASAALNSLHTISFEPGSPTTAHLLDDVIGAVLTVEPVEAAWPGGPPAIVAAGSGWRRFPAPVAALTESVLAEATPLAASPSGLRVTVLTETGRAPGIVGLADVVPALNIARGVGPDPVAAFRAAMQATLGSSVREGQIFPASAVHSLGDLPLVCLPAFTAVDAVPGWTAEQRLRLTPLLTEYDDHHRLVPASGEVAAMWVVDPDTGSATAVGEDGRGGAGGKFLDCLVPDDDGEMVLAFIGYALALISSACLMLNPGVGTVPYYRCVGADVYGAGVAALGAFVAPPNVPAAAFGALSYGIGLVAPEAAAGRGIIMVLLLIGQLITAGMC